MSATGRNLEGNERHALDFYETEGWVTRSILEVLPVSGYVIDPGCGTGAILREVIRSCRNDLSVARGIELDPERCRIANEDETTMGHVVQGDFLSYAAECASQDRAFNGEHYADFVIGNPPYNIAEEFLDASRKIATTVILLLRLNFLGSQKRAGRFALAMPDIYVLPKRPSFTEDGRTDATEYAWFVWNGTNSVGTIRMLRVPPDAQRRRPKKKAGDWADPLVKR